MCEKVVVPRALLLCGPVCHGCQDSEADQAGGRQDSCDNSNRREPKVKKQLFLFNNQNWTTIDNPFETQRWAMLGTESCRIGRFAATSKASWVLERLLC